MTDQNKAQISALMDGELDENAVKNLLADESIKHTWTRYHIISDVIQNHTPLHTDSRLTLRISELIQNEPAILAPLPRKPVTYLRPIAGFAVAASVTALAIMGVLQYRSEPIAPETAMITANSSPASIPVASVGVPLEIVNAVNVRPVQQVVQGPAVNQSNLNATKMNRYILNHNEYQSNTGVHGVTPHVRLVATDGK